MASSDTEIANLALSHLGQTEIEDLTTDASEAAQVMRRVYTTNRDFMLRMAPWPFATKIVALGLVEEEPNDEWDYSYRYPSNCIFFRRILSGSRNDSLGSRVSYRVVQDDQGLLIHTDKDEAEGEYTFRETNVSRFPEDFVQALAYKMAADAAPRLTGGDPFKLKPLMERLHQIWYTFATAAAGNEEQPDEPVDSEFITGR
jgi:hypothetical protein